MNSEMCASDCNAKLALIERRLDDLEKADRKHVEFRKEYYEDREKRIYRDAQLDTKIDGINEKLDKLIVWQEAQQSKPGKRWDAIVEKVIWAVLAALITFVLAKIGIG